MDGVHVLNREQARSFQLQLDVCDRTGAELVVIRRCPRCPGMMAADTRHGLGVCGYCGHGPIAMTGEAAAAAAAVDVTGQPAGMAGPPAGELAGRQGLALAQAPIEPDRAAQITSDEGGRDAD